MEDLSEEDPEEEKMNEVNDKSRQILKQRNVFRKLRENKLRNTTNRLKDAERKKVLHSLKVILIFLKKIPTVNQKKKTKK